MMHVVCGWISDACSMWVCQVMLVACGCVEGCMQLGGVSRDACGMWVCHLMHAAWGCDKRHEGLMHV